MVRNRYSLKYARNGSRIQAGDWQHARVAGDRPGGALHACGKLP